VDFTAFNAALAQLLTDVGTLLTAENNLVAQAIAAGQAQIDAATAALTAADVQVVAAEPQPAPAPTPSSFGS